jgi:hypothetical protein
LVVVFVFVIEESFIDTVRRLASAVPLSDDLNDFFEPLVMYQTLMLEFVPRRKPCSIVMQFAINDRLLSPVSHSNKTSVVYLDQTVVAGIDFGGFVRIKPISQRLLPARR